MQRKQRELGFRRWRNLIVVIGGLLATGATAHAANLVNRGGASDVPTYEGRIYYIKPFGVSCPSGFNCFCNSGSTCTLPGTGTITGTVVIDRGGVTLDCQNRIIQAPGFGSAQACRFDFDCGYYAGTTTQHECVSGFCQLANLAGVNVGGPLNVDDGSINIDVTVTGFMQDVEVRNCVVRKFALGYNVDGAAFDNGDDQLQLWDNEFRNRGIRVSTTDNTLSVGNWVNDVEGEGTEVIYSWGLRSLFDTVASIDSSGLGAHISPPSGYNRGLELTGSSYTGYRAATFLYGFEGTGMDAACDSSAAQCDLRFERNKFRAGPGPTWDRNADIVIAGSVNALTFLLRDNVLDLFQTIGGLVSTHVMGETQDVMRRCWTKGNSCSTDGQPSTCTGASWFTGSTCWY